MDRFIKAGRPETAAGDDLKAERVSVVPATTRVFFLFITVKTDKLEQDLIVPIWFSGKSFQSASVLLAISSTSSSAQSIANSTV